MQWTSAPNIGEAPLPQRARGYWKTWVSAAREGLEKRLEAERAQLPPWFVVGFGSGIAAWFALDSVMEWRAFLCVSVAFCVGGFALGSGRVGRALGWFALAATLGCALIWIRSGWVAQPRLDHPVVAVVAGNVERVDHLAARDKVRLLIRPDDPALPPRVRISIDEDKFPPGIAPGSRISVRARLAPPPPMALPGTYDFARDAWFRELAPSESHWELLRSIRRRRRTDWTESANDCASISPRACPKAQPALPLLWSRETRMRSTRMMPTQCAAVASRTCCP